MSQLGDAIEEVRSELAGSAEEFMPDTCNLIPPLFQDVSSGDKVVAGTIIQGVPCSHKQLSGGTQFGQGKTDELVMPYTDDTVAIDHNYKIQVLARGFNPEMYFDQPSVQRNSMSPLLKVFATLVDGHRQEFAR